MLADRLAGITQTRERLCFDGGKMNRGLAAGAGAA